MCSMTFRLKKEYFDSEETLSISFIIFARSILAMKTQHRFEDILGRNSFVPEVPFFLEKIEAMDSSESFFNRRTSAKRKWQCCFLSRGLEDKRRSENIAFPFIVKSLPGSREARRIISIILWQSTLLVEEEHFLHFFSTNTDFKIRRWRKEYSRNEKWRRRHL